MKNPAIRALTAAAGVLCAVVGIVGMFVPVLPTTPLLLLAGFLLARSSNRLNAWLEGTRAYQAYVIPFKENRGIAFKTKVRILCVSFAVMAVSAFAVRNIETWNVVVWIVLALVSCWLLYLMSFRIPTLEAGAAPQATEGEAAN